MRGLVALVIAMGVLIVAGVGVVAITIARRAGEAIPPPATTEMVLDQPAGTQIAGVAGLGPRVALILRGGGPDRVVVLEAGRVAGTIRLAR